MFLSMLDGVSQNSYCNYQFFPPHVCLFLHSEMKHRYCESRIWKDGIFCLVVESCQHYTFDHFLPDWGWTKCSDWTKINLHQCVPSFFNSVSCCKLSNCLTWVEVVNFIKPPSNKAPATKLLSHCGNGDRYNTSVCVCGALVIQN